ncbi:hypothetical protein ACFV19_03660 [Streptomyces griseoluteus]|uniref:hypothetical protein n=1 Tax=Streptomyces griseoluteus TaxID=29306 RepID=UPI00368EC108
MLRWSSEVDVRPIGALDREELTEQPVACCVAKSGSPVDPRNLNRHWCAPRKRVGLHEYRLHDLRHSFVCLCLDLGAAPHIVWEIARHSDLQFTLGV